MPQAHDDIDLSQFIATLYDPAPGHCVLLAQQISWTDYAGKPQTGFRQYVWSTSLLKAIERRPGAWYVCVSTVDAPEGDAKPRRRKQDCREAQIIVCDDIGTKVPRDTIDKVAALGVPFSFILETSAGNYQGGWLIEPEADTDYYEACVRAILAAGYGDAGSGGISRVFRVPGSINLKPGRGDFRTAVVDWAPANIYELGILMDQLGLTPEAVPERDGPVALEADIDDPVVAWLEANSRIIGEDSDFLTVSCPWAHAHTDGNPGAGYSPLGHGQLPLYRVFHCFHEHCQHRRGADFLAWVAEQGGPDVDTSGTREVTAEQLANLADPLTTAEQHELLRVSLPPLRKTYLPDVVYTAGGATAQAQRPTYANIRYILDTYGIDVHHNVMSRELDLAFTDPNLDALAGDGEHVMRCVVDGCYRLGIASQTDVYAVVNEVGRQHSYHPMQDWITSVEWDGVSRFDALCDTVQVDGPYTDIWRTYLQRWLIQGVQAVCGWPSPKQMRAVLVLAGEQGLGKTMWFQSLVPRQYFAEGVQMNLAGAYARDSIARATLRPIAELGELDTTFRQADAGALKAFLSAEWDVYREPYARNTRAWPRCTSFGASVNRRDFLVDHTGSTRYWPVWCLHIDKDHCVDMQQLWAEVYTWWLMGSQWWLTPDEDARRHNLAGAFTVIEEAEQAAAQWFLDHDDSRWEAMNLSRFMRDKLLLKPSNRDSSLVRQIVERHLGPSARQLNGVQNAWRIPVGLKKISERLQQPQDAEPHKLFKR